MMVSPVCTSRAAAPFICIVPEPRHGKADAVDRDRPLLDDVAGEIGRQRDPHHLPVRRRRARNHTPGPVNVALDDVAAEPTIDRDRPLEVHVRPITDVPQRRAVQRLGHHVGGELATRKHLHHRQAHTVHRDRVARRRIAGDDGTADPQPHGVRQIRLFDDTADLFDDPGEHQHRLVREPGSPP